MTARDGRAIVTVVFVLVLAFSPSAPAQEVVVGGEAALLPSLTLSPRLFELAHPRLRSQLTTITSVYAENIELRASATLWHEITPPTVDELEATGVESLETTGVALDELTLRATPAPWAVVELGRFRYPVGRAFLLSPNDTYTSVSFDAIVRGDFDAAGSAQTLATATAFFGPASFTLAAVPVPAVPQLVEPGSLWIPRLPVDEVIDDPRISPDPVTLNEIFAEPTRRIDEVWERVSGGAHAGVFLGPVDVSLYYYHGVDPAPVPRARIDFPNAPIDSYDLYVAPEEAVIDSFGLAAEGVAGSSTLWLDASFVPNKTLATTTISQYSKRSRLETAPTLTAVGGASYRAGGPDLLLVGEYYFGYSFLPEDVAAEDVVVSPLANDLLLSANLRLGGRSQWALALAGLVSFDDGGAVLSASVEWKPTTNVRSALRAPVFLGPADSDFGQYSDIVHVVSEIRVLF